jgi:acetyl esterase
VVSYSYDPELAAIVPLLPRVDIQDVSLARAKLDERVAQLSSTVDDSTLSIEDYQVTGHGGDPEVTVRVFRSQRATGDVPALLYIHGGGFVLGSVASEQDNAATLASTLDIVVASVEYRLAPEHPFPAGLHDCFAALNWLCQHADDLGVDRTRVGVYGSSAGGGLAAAWLSFVAIAAVLRCAFNSSPFQCSTTGSRHTACVRLSTRQNGIDPAQN